MTLANSYVALAGSGGLGGTPAVGFAHVSLTSNVQVTASLHSSGSSTTGYCVKEYWPTLVTLVQRDKTITITSGATGTVAITASVVANTELVNQGIDSSVTSGIGAATNSAGMSFAQTSTTQITGTLISDPASAYTVIGYVTAVTTR